MTLLDMKAVEEFAFSDLQLNSVRVDYGVVYRQIGNTENTCFD